ERFGCEAAPVDARRLARRRADRARDALRGDARALRVGRGLDARDEARVGAAATPAPARERQQPAVPDLRPAPAHRAQLAVVASVCAARRSTSATRSP